MHCWKSYKVDKRYQFNRQFFISTLIALLAFMLLYVPIQKIAGTPLRDQYFAVFLAGLVFLYPVHKLLHFIPIMKYARDIKIELDVYYYLLPIIDLQMKNPVSKKRFIVALLFPVVIINVLLLCLMAALPNYVHYLTILLAYHVGLCAVDLKVLKALLSSPKNCMIEENERDFQILINE